MSVSVCVGYAMCAYSIFFIIIILLYIVYLYWPLYISDENNTHDQIDPKHTRRTLYSSFSVSLSITQTRQYNTRTTVAFVLR